MPLIEDTDKFIQWRYQLSEFIILYSNSSYEVPLERTSAISLFHDYENNLFPVFKWEIILEPSVYYEIMKSKDTLKFKIRIQKYYKERGKTEKSLLRDYINSTFSLIMDDDPNDYEESIKRNANIPSDKNDLRKVDNRIEFFLYKDETIMAMKTNVNTVISSSTVTGALAYVISKSGWGGKTLMSPSENTEVFNEMLIPPQNTLNAIQYLDTNFGIYKKGSIIYFGLDYGYILNYKGGCTAYLPNEIKDVCILVPEKTTPTASDSGMIQKREQQTRFYVLAQPNFVIPRNQSISNDIINGNNATIINSRTSEISTVNSNAIGRGNGNRTIIDNTSNNKWIGETYAAQRSADSIVISVSLGDIDLEVINPNKKFVFIFEDTLLANKYKGIYVIAQASVKFIKDGADFSANANLVFKRVGDDPTTAETYLATDQDTSVL